MPPYFLAFITLLILHKCLPPMHMHSICTQCFCCRSKLRYSDPWMQSTGRLFKRHDVSLPAPSHLVDRGVVGVISMLLSSFPPTKKSIGKVGLQNVADITCNYVPHGQTLPNFTNLPCNYRCQGFAQLFGHRGDHHLGAVGLPTPIGARHQIPWEAWEAKHVVPGKTWNQ